MNGLLMDDLVEILQAVDGLEPGVRFIAEDLLRLCDEDAGRSSDLGQPNCQNSKELRDILLLLQISLFEGNLCISSRPRDIEDLLVRRGVSGEVGTPTANRLAHLIADPGLEAAVEPLFRHGILVRKTAGNTVYLYPGRHYRAIERICSFALQISKASTTIKNERLKQWFEEVLRDRPIMAGGRPVTFTAEQRLALMLGLTEPFFVLSGGPGTGKTTIILNLLRLLIRSGIPTERIRLAAPTGKAAARMMESITSGLESIEQASEADRSISLLKASTLHRLLGIRPGATGPDYHADNPIPADVVVVDEVSMVDAVMMGYLLSAIDPVKTRLILLGDRDQLPSVDAGAVLADLLALLSEEGEPAFTEDVLKRAEAIMGPDEAWTAARRKVDGPNRYVHLTHSHRSERAVRDLARWVNTGGQGSCPLETADVSILESSIEEGTFLFERPDNAGMSHLESLIRSWGSFAFPSEWEVLLKELSRREPPPGREVNDDETIALVRSLFRLFERSRVLTVLRRGLYGAENIQRIFQRYMMKRGMRERRGLFSGLPVLVRRNDPLRGLANGDTGLVIQFSNQRFLVVFDGAPVTAFSPDVLPLWEPAYAMTVHKSQGSEYRDVLIVLPDDAAHPLMNRQILYTGITRARKAAYLYGREDEIAFSAGKTLRRITGFE